MLTSKQSLLMPNNTYVAYNEIQSPSRKSAYGQIMKRLRGKNAVTSLNARELEKKIEEASKDPKHGE